MLTPADEAKAFPHSHAVATLRVSKQAATPLTLETLYDFWRLCRYQRSPQHTVRFAQYCQLYLLHDALTQAKVTHRAIQLIDPRRLNPKKSDDLAQHIQKRVILVNRMLSCPGGNAITWHMRLNERAPTLTSHAAWQATYAKIAILQAWIGDSIKNPPP